MPRPPVRRFALPAVAAATVLALAAPATAAPATSRRPAPVAYVANFISGTISRIALATGRARPPVRLGAKSGPWDIAVAPGGQTIWVASTGNGTVTPVSTRTGRPGRSIKVPRLPRNLAIAPDGKTLWVASEISGTDQDPGRVTPVSTVTGRAGQPIRVGIDPGPILISPDSRTVYVGTAGTSTQGAAGNLTVISARTDLVRRVVQGLNVTDMAMGRGGRTLYVAVWAEPGALIPVRTATLRPGRPIRLPEYPQQMIMSPDRRSVYVLGETGSVTRVSTRTDRVLWKIRSTADDPAAIGVTPDGRRLYVLGDSPLRRRRGYLVPIGATYGLAGRRIQVGHDPLAIAFGPRGRTAYVLCSPTWATGASLKFGIGSVFPVSVASGRVGKPVLAGRGSLYLAIVPGRTYEPAGAGPEK